MEVGDETDLKKKSVDEPDMPLSEGVLTTNLGLDIVVVITKVKLASSGFIFLFFLLLLLLSEPISNCQMMFNTPSMFLSRDLY